MSGPTPWFVVVNPASGAGRAGRRWPALERALSAAGVEFEAAVTSHPGHATALVADALRRGFRRILAVGGDGVLHEALNGVMGQHEIAPSGVCLGAAPLGSGNDAARAQRIPTDPQGTARCVAAGRAVLQDIGRLDFPQAGPDGRACHFINVAGTGLDGYVLARLPRRVPRRLAYLIGVLRSLATFRSPVVDLDVDGHHSRERLLLAMVALGPYCGGGMHLAPMADTDDGALDLLRVRPLRLPAELVKLRRLFDGRLPEESLARYARVREMRIEADPPAVVQADGQIVGRTPCVVTLLPRAILTLRG